LLIQVSPVTVRTRVKKKEGSRPELGSISCHPH
jgi:hypothetical protein